MKIEKNIFQTFKTRELPYQINSIISNMLNTNPDYKYYFFDDNDILQFIRNNFESNIFSAYLKLKIGAARADFFRYLVLFKYGGIYLDIDSTPKVCFDQIIHPQDSAIITRENNPSPYFAQWCLFFCKGHPVLSKIIEIVTRNIHDFNKDSFLSKRLSLKVEELPVHKITGPTAYTNAIKEYYNNVFSNYDIHQITDEEINKKITDSTRFFKTDYDGLINFNHEHSDKLYEPYTSIKHWTKQTGYSLL